MIWALAGIGIREWNSGEGGIKFFYYIVGYNSVSFCEEGRYSLNDNLLVIKSAIIFRFSSVYDANMFGVSLRTL